MTSADGLGSPGVGPAGDAGEVADGGGERAASATSGTSATSNGRERCGLAIIGGGPAGVSAAQGYLDAGGSGPVVMVTSDVDPPYQRPPLSKDVLAGRAAPEGQPIEGELPPEVDLRLATTVSAVDLRERTLRLGEEHLAFDRLIVAAGAHPNPLPTADDDAEVHLLRSLTDAQRLVRSAVHARSAVVIGSGFIGCEAAASLAIRGVQTTLVTPEDAPQAKRLGQVAGARLAQWLIGAGVELRTGVTVTGVRAPRTVHLDDGTTLEPDLVLAAVGVTPNGALLEGSGVNVYEDRIVAEEHLLAAPGVWVAGDVARAHHEVAGRPIEVEHWGDALAMGELAGRNAATDGDPQAWETIPGFWSVIGEHTLKYSAWGDGYETAELVPRTGGFTVWYGDADGALVGVLTYEADDDYERGQQLLEQGASLQDALRGDG